MANSSISPAEHLGENRTVSCNTVSYSTVSYSTVSYSRRPSR